MMDQTSATTTATTTVSTTSTTTPSTLIVSAKREYLNAKWLKSKVLLLNSQDDSNISLSTIVAGGIGGATITGTPTTGGGGGSGSSVTSNLGGIGNISGTGVLSEGQRSISGALSATPSPVLSPPGRIFGRNANGTMIATSTPNNEAELQLYRVLQKASLLAYYDTLLEMGGDDVQQLCDAGEEEFLEIMALVGMASKPLHVRRLQKALHEWANNPSQFQTPLPSETNPLLFTPEPTTSRPKFNISPSFNPTPLMSTATNIPQTNLGFSPLTAGSGTGAGSLASGNITPQVTSSSPQLTPVLSEAKIARIQMIAEKMAKQIPQKEPRQQNSKKRTSRELEQVMAMSENDPRRMDEIRKYAAIYGRFDCKRRPEKPLTFHEVCVNEGAAQICRYVPALLTRRDELFPLARQLVKDVGFGHTSSSSNLTRYNLNQQQQQQQQQLQQQIKSDDPSDLKRSRLSSSDAITTDYNKDFLDDSRMNLFAMYQKFAKPPFDLSDISKFSLSRSDYDEENDNDNDSRFSFSTSSSPPLPLGSDADAMNSGVRETNENGKNDHHHHHQQQHQHNDNDISMSPLGVQIISAAGNHIIAVANPALALSPTLNDSLTIKRETISPTEI